MTSPREPHAVLRDGDAPRNSFADVPLRRSPEELWRERPRSRFVRFTLLALALLVAYSWFAGDIQVDDLFTARRRENLERFLTVDVRPYELRDADWTIGSYARWAWDLGLDRGFQGAVATLGMSILAITLAALAAAGLALFASRTVATARPFEARDRTASNAVRGREWAWRAVASTVRGLLVFLRAIPEYVWAFLLLAMLGATAWPAILALAIHNSGILGKLGAETVENLDPRSLRALRGLGATRGRIAIAAIFPLSLSRYLLYVFYRFETCVREATVLGMLGVVSLGYWIQDARSRQFYDQMVLFVGFGAGIVLCADLFSSFVRAKLRKAG